jgi:hypothetical protein
MRHCCYLDPRTLAPCTRPAKAEVSGRSGVEDTTDVCTFHIEWGKLIIGGPVTVSLIDDEVAEVSPED